MRGGCWGGGGAVAVMEKRLGQPVTGNGDGGELRCYCGATAVKKETKAR